MSKIVAIVPAAGSGKRFGEDLNKVFYPVANKPLILWALQVLESVKGITEIIPVIKEEYLIRCREIIDEYNISKVKMIVPGGKERQDSVYNALRYLDDKTSIVLIHDGARPVIEKDMIENVIKELMICAASGVDGVVVGVPVNDTIKEIIYHKTEDRRQRNEDVEIFVKKTLDRSVLWSIQTPQVFSFRKLKDAYESAFIDKFYSTDDSSLVERYGGTVKVITGSYKNIKITTPEDINLAEVFLSS